MKCSVYIATSVDGFIARPDDSLDWLEKAGKPENGFGAGYIDSPTYLADVDCIIMGRKCMDVISSFNLSDEQWPYGSLRIIVLSNTVQTPPENLRKKVEIYSGDLRVLMSRLEEEGHKHAYVDGGMTIQAFLKLGLIEEMTITQIPVLLGEGKPLFGKEHGELYLSNARAVASPSDYIQLRYDVNYPS